MVQALATYRVAEQPKWVASDSFTQTTFARIRMHQMELAAWSIGTCPADSFDHDEHSLVTYSSVMYDPCAPKNDDNAKTALQLGAYGRSAGSACWAVPVGARLFNSSQCIVLLA